jgi:hypothetical protein
MNKKRRVSPLACAGWIASFGEKCNELLSFFVTGILHNLSCRLEVHMLQQKPASGIIRKSASDLLTVHFSVPAPKPFLVKVFRTVAESWLREKDQKKTLKVPSPQYFLVQIV